jgi:hypothetical protein
MIRAGDPVAQAFRGRGTRSECHCERHQCGFSRQRAFGALAFGDFSGDETGEITIDLLLVGAVADAADEQVGIIADEELIGLTPLNEFEVIGFHGWTSRMPDLTSFSC